MRLELACDRRAAVSAFVARRPLVRPLFKHAWCREAGMDPNARRKASGEDLRRRVRRGADRGVRLRVLLGPQPGRSWSGARGLMVGVCYVAMSFGINYAFGRPQLQAVVDRCGLPTSCSSRCTA
jgi:hypothetical protein